MILKNKKMRVLAKLKPELGIWDSISDIPEIGVSDVLIKIHKTAICGTDLHIYMWDNWAQKTIPVPMHVGHEYVGEIVSIGSEVENFKIGDRVSGEGHIACSKCRNCRGGREHLCIDTVGVGVTRSGAFAEYLAIPAKNAFKVPSDISDDIVSVFDPLGNSVHTALAFDLVGEDVLITGAGPVGLFAAQIAKFVGARNIVITDINSYRLNLARKMGINNAIDLSDCKAEGESFSKIKSVIKSLGMKEGFDVGMEMSGSEYAFRDMLNTMNNGANIAFLGIPSKPFAIDWSSFVFKGITIKGIYGREMFETWYKMTSMLQSGLDVSPVITHKLPINKYLDGFELMRSGQCGKVILDWCA